MNCDEFVNFLDYWIKSNEWVIEAGLFSRHLCYSVMIDKSTRCPPSRDVPEFSDTWPSFHLHIFCNYQIQPRNSTNASVLILLLLSLLLPLLLNAGRLKIAQSRVASRIACDKAAASRKAVASVERDAIQIIAIPIERNAKLLSGVRITFFFSFRKKKIIISFVNNSVITFTRTSNPYLLQLGYITHDIIHIFHLTSAGVWKMIELWSFSIEIDDVNMWAVALSFKTERHRHGKMASFLYHINRRFPPRSPLVWE